MKHIQSIISFTIITLILCLLYSCNSVKTDKESQTIIKTNVDGQGFAFTISFEKGNKHHYPLMAVWLENASGEYIQTLFVAKSVGSGIFDHADASAGKWQSGELRRAATLPYWAHKRNTVLKKEDVFPTAKYPVSDAYTGATPKSNFVLQTKSDNAMHESFKILFEINQFFDFNDFWTNIKFTEDKDYQTSGQPALVYSTDIISIDKLPATFDFRLIGHSHYSGKTGELFTSLQTITTAKRIVKFIQADVNPK